MRIVVVEDVEELAWLAEHYLTPAGHEVVTERRITDPMLQPDHWQGVDCAVVDARLPGRAGEVLLAFLKAACPRVRRVLCSASMEMGDAAPLADVTLLKPYDKEEILEAVQP